MKKLLTLVAAFALAIQLQAQIAPNSIAPDFTATDLQGNTYTLYDILNAGKPVVMDVSATWCGPCWNYHNGHALKDLYEQYGPNGTNELMVLFVEGDGSTNTDCLYDLAGCNSSSQGDWVTGTPYPILDNSEISNLYEIGYFPTVYLICDNHLVREVGQLSAAGLYQQASQCPNPVQGLSLQVMTLSTDIPFTRVCGTQTVTPELLVLNQGTETISSLTYEVRLNGQLVETATVSNTIPSFYPAQLQLNPITLNGASILKVTVTQLNGSALATPIVKQISYQAAKKTDTQNLTLELRTDNYGEETYWELLDDQGNQLAHGGNENVGPNGGGTGGATAGPGAYGNVTTYTESIDVPADGCYYLHVVDAYGDGMCFNGVNGYFKLYETADPTNILTEGDCDFADAIDVFKGEGIVGISDLIETGNIRLYPNPASDVLRVDFNVKSATNANITVANAMGQIVRTIDGQNFAAGINTVNVQLSGLASGAYVLSINTTEGAVSRTFTVKQ